MARKKKYTMSRHAQDRMNQRSVKRSHIDDALYRPDRMSGVRNGKQIHEKRVRPGRNPIIRVIVAIPRAIIVTVMYCRKFKNQANDQ